MRCEALVDIGQRFQGCKFSFFSEPVPECPRSWWVIHISLCLIGVNNVFFMKTLPIFARLASLIYQAAWMCLSAPLLFFHIYNIEWGASFSSTLESMAIVIYNSFTLTLGITYMINALKSNRTSRFCRKWHLFCSDRSFSDGDVKTRRFRGVRVAIVVSTVSQLVLVLASVVQSFSISHWSVCPFLFPSLQYSLLLKPICVFYVVMANFSTISVSLTSCLFALVTMTLAVEFDKLYQAFSNLTSSGGVDMDVWEQVRFRHAALVSLVRLHDQLSTMLLGPIITGHVIYLCLGLYYILVIHMAVLDVFNIAMSLAVLWAIIMPSDVLDNMVSEIFITSNNSLKAIFYYVYEYTRNAFLH